MKKEKQITEDDLIAMQSILKFINKNKNKIKNYNHLVNAEFKQEEIVLFRLTIKYREFLVDYFNGIHQTEMNQKLKDIVEEVKKIAQNTVT